MILALFVSYFIGSIPTAYLVAKWIRGIDIRKVGSGNVGATNVFRTLGKQWGIAVLIFDMFKGFFVSYYVAAFFYKNDLIISILTLRIILGIASMVGHVFPIWLRFKGGKGVATACGVFLGIYPKAVIVSLTVWILVAIVFKYVSLASLVAAFSFPFNVLVFYQHRQDFLLSEIFACVLFLFITYTHRSNIKRLLNGSENKIGKKKK